MWSVSINPLFLDLDSVAGSEWSASRPCRYTVRIRGPCHLLVCKSLGGPQRGSGRCGEDKIIDPTETRTRPPGRSTL
jgi:hypothetical protein